MGCRGNGASTLNDLTQIVEDAKGIIPFFKGNWDKSNWNKRMLLLGEAYGHTTSAIILSKAATEFSGESDAALKNAGRYVDDTVKGAGKVNINNANFAQKTYSSKFSAEDQKIYSELAGKPITTVDDLISALKNGTIKASDVPIDYIVRDGNTLILNTRSSQALIQAGIPRSQWNIVNRTGNSLFEEMITGQLTNNGLTSAGTSTVKMSGGSK